MWKEYAVQPETLVQSKDAFRALFFSCGWEHGRLIAQYPTKDWLRRVHDALKKSPIGDVARVWVTDKLQNERFRLVPGGRPYDPGLLWLQNAVNQQTTANPFDGIIAMENPRGHASVCLSDDVSDTTPIFVSPSNIHIPRLGADMAACVRRLLERSREVIFIDPYFGCLEERFVRVLRTMLSLLSNSANSVSKIEYHLSQGSLFLDHAEFSRRLKQRVERHVPPGVSMNFFVWSPRPGGELLHDRFILTELGGVDFSVGLDEGDPGQTTKVTRLSTAAYSKVKRDFDLGSPAFDLCHSCTVARPI